MIRAFLLLLSFVCVMNAAPASAQQDSLTPEQQALVQKFRVIKQQLHPQYGDIRIAEADSVLHLGGNYYFLPADQAKLVLKDGWGNSQEATEGVLGMIFPRDKEFFDDTWAAVITYSGDGFVSDDDANSTDYDALLRSVQEQEDSVNTKRKEEGLASMHLVGWAQPPTYDRDRHTLVWARNIRFGDETDDTLNYDVRILGRRGVLSMNIVSVMSQLTTIRARAAELQNLATFNAGARYSDFAAGTDQKATYGIGGLIAAGVGGAIAQKLGLFAIMAAFLKKAGVIIVAAFAGAFAWIRNLFKRKPSE